MRYSYHIDLIIYHLVQILSAALDCQIVTQIAFSQWPQCTIARISQFQFLTPAPVNSFSIENIDLRNRNFIAKTETHWGLMKGWMQHFLNQILQTWLIIRELSSLQKYEKACRPRCPQEMKSLLTRMLINLQCTYSSITNGALPLLNMRNGMPKENFFSWEESM